MTTSASRRRALVAGLFITLIVVGLWSFSERFAARREVAVFAGATMGTTFQVKVVAHLDARQRQRVQSQIDAILADVNAQMSTYIPDSEISRFNNSASVSWISISKEFAFVVALAKSIWAQSDGALDPTVLPLVEAWGFGAKGGRKDPPTQKVLHELLAKTGMAHIDVREEPPALRKVHPEVSLDLSAVAKGHGVDRLAQLIEQLGYSDYLVEIGGELRVSGYNPADKPWALGIEKPEQNGRHVQKQIWLTSGALATSGDYRNYREVAGKRLSHIINPRTGMPVDHRLVSVSIVAETCAVADGWATALLVLGPEQAMATANRLGLAAYLLVMTDEGLIEKASAGFANEAWRKGALSQ